MFKDLLGCIRIFVESDNKIRVMLNLGDAVCWERGMLDVGFEGYWGCGISRM